jgi:lipopolysaccharide/colanic/teichoic acid biosynthesis glycosyltransferase
MGRVHAVVGVGEKSRERRVLAPLLRGADVVIASVVLLLTLPLMAVLAVAVRQSSVGPVLHREPGLDPQGRPVQLFTFRTNLDGSGTVAHQRLRAAIGADATGTLTGIGRFMRATRMHLLPRLLNVVAGQAGLLGR